jgi:hypothetical protein
MYFPKLTPCLFVDAYSGDLDERVNGVMEAINGCESRVFICLGSDFLQWELGHQKYGCLELECSCEIDGM